MKLSDSQHNELIQPIKGDSPTGIDIRKDSSANSLYYQIKDARANARQIERDALSSREPTSARCEWDKVSSIAIDILKEHSKDLDVCAWLIEALVRQHEFAGFAFGLKLTKELIITYWDTLFPLADEDGLSSKISALTGLNGESSEGSLIMPLTTIPITDKNTAKPFSLWQYHKAREIEAITDPDLRNKRFDEIGFAFADIEKAINESSHHFYQSLYNSVNTALDEFSAFNTVLQEHCAKDAPPSSQIKHALNTFKYDLSILAKDKLASFHEPEDTEEAMQPDTNIKPTFKPNNREEALAVLLNIGTYFRQHEPHSPVPFLLERAVRWGRLPLPDLLKELVGNDEERNKVFHLTGIDN